MKLSCLEILSSLVAIPTVSRESNLPLVDWVRNYLADLGIDSHLVLNADGTKSNLYATVGPLAPGGLILSGHTDVVPVDDQKWSSDPFQLAVRGSRLHGRGTSDMKGFIAAVLARLPEWQQARFQRPVHLLLSYDEEIGCLGVPSMIKEVRQTLPRPEVVIVGEPTGMRVATQHKGACYVQTEVIGIEAHSSLTNRGVSAIMLAGELIAHLGEMSQKLASAPVAEAKAFEPPYTTISVNRITGGSANNILAGRCEFIWDIRSLPGENSGTILGALTSLADRRLAELLLQNKGCYIRTTVLADAPPLQAELDGSAAALARAVGARPDQDVAVPFGTEAGHFQQAGWSTVVCGPGSIEQAHRPDEFIELSQLNECEAFLDRLVKRQLLPGERASHS